MIRITFLLSIIAILTGCALNVPACLNAGAVVTSQPVPAVLPNSKPIAGQQRYRIELRGFQRTHSTTIAKQVQGIAL